MHEYRQALMRLRQGDSEREIARSGLMGRAKAARFRELAREKGWLELTRPLPPDAEIAAALAPPRVPLTAATSVMVMTRRLGLPLRRFRLISRPQVGWHILGK